MQRDGEGHRSRDGSYADAPGGNTLRAITMTAGWCRPARQRR